MSHSSPFRTLALVLALVMLVLAATPARAEALEPLTIVALVGLAVAGIVLIAYLIIANVEGPKMADESPRMGDEGPRVLEEESPKLADEGRMILAAPIPES